MIYTARQSGQLATCTTEPVVASTLGVTQDIKLRSDREIRMSLCADVRMEDYIRLQWKICYNILAASDRYKNETHPNTTEITTSSKSKEWKLRMDTTLLSSTESRNISFPYKKKVKVK